MRHRDFIKDLVHELTCESNERERYLDVVVHITQRLPTSHLIPQVEKVRCRYRNFGELAAGDDDRLDALPGRRHLAASDAADMLT